MRDSGFIFKMGYGYWRPEEANVGPVYVQDYFKYIKLNKSYIYDVHPPGS